MAQGTMSGPLSGVTVVELEGIGPGPYCGQLLADMGADVIVISRSPKGQESIQNRGKRVVAVNLKTAEGVEIIHKLIAKADILFEGFRPGVTEKLGIGPADCHAINPALVYGRMTGWGQTGPWSSMAGHDINYISVTGALYAMGEKDRPPPPPLNMVGDFGGGSMFLLTGLLAALLKARETGKGDVVDAAIVDGVSSMMGFIGTMAGQKQWDTNRRASNLLDGAAPFYQCYETSDGRHVAVGCIEPQFFAAMLEVSGVSPDEYGPQLDVSQWPRQQQLLADVFRQKTMAEWTDLYDGTDACVSPVLTPDEATQHKHNAVRQSHTQHGAFSHPAPAPRFVDTVPAISENDAKTSYDLDSVLDLAGYSADDKTRLLNAGAIKA